MSGFITTPLLITDYYDSLISQLDIYTEETIKEYREKGLPVKTNRDTEALNESFNDEETDEKYGVETLNNPYEPKRYTIYQTNISEITDISQAEEYMNKVRQKSIDEIRKVQDENLEYYKANKDKFKVEKENLTEEKLEELKSQLFAAKFCFLIKREPLNIREKGSQEKYGPLFNLHTVITDFYLRECDIYYIRSRIETSYKINHPSKILDKRFLLTNQVLNYINETLNGDLNAYEIIPIKQKTLFNIQHIEVKSFKLEFNETDLSPNDIDLSSIKSLTLKVEAKISDFSAFANLEYLCISSIKLYQWSFQNLRKSIRLKIANCDLSEFDFDSLNSITSLQIIEIKADISETFKIDLNRLINLKWIDLEFTEEQDEEDETTFELHITDDSYNQLTKVVLNYKSMDFSKQLDLPALKCLDISNVDLSEQINKQSFNGFYNLIELNLANTYLTNVDFLDTDRLGNLELLDLSNNEITVMRKGAFSKLKKLKKLDLNNNLIQGFIIGVFEGLECLEYLDINLNYFKVESIDKKVFDGLNCLKILRDYEREDDDNVY